MQNLPAEVTECQRDIQLSASTSPIVLRCVVKGPSSVEVAFSRNGRQLPVSSTLVTTGSSGSKVAVHTLSEPSAGTYGCHALVNGARRHSNCSWKLVDYEGNVAKSSAQSKGEHAPHLIDSLTSTGIVEIFIRFNGHVCHSEFHGKADPQANTCTLCSTNPIIVWIFRTVRYRRLLLTRTWLTHAAEKPIEVYPHYYTDLQFEPQHEKWDTNDIFSTLGFWCQLIVWLVLLLNTLRTCVATALPRVTAGGWALFVRRTFLSG